jgi:hypothetical protein
MTIPPDVLNDVLDDLASLKLAGDASPGTIALLESYAREHPEFAAQLNVAGGIQLPAAPTAGVADGALKALKRTRQHILLRTIFSAMGIAFTVLPFSVVGGKDGVRFLFLHDQPGVVQAFLSVAAASWVATWLMHREIRRTGL